MIRGLWLAATLLLASALLAAAEFRQVKGGRIAARLTGKALTRRDEHGVAHACDTAPVEPAWGGVNTWNGVTCVAA